MPFETVVATILRPEGETGVQTHVRTCAEVFSKMGYLVDVITPFDARLWRVYPVFGLRKVIEWFHSGAGVWWYRKWHGFFLRDVLRARLAGGNPCVVYAQCPVSALAALEARANTSQLVIMVVHFNVSQAEEWALKGCIKVNGVLYSDIVKFESEIISRLDGIVFVSRFMRQRILLNVPHLAKLPSALVPNFLQDPFTVLDAEPFKRMDLINIGTLERRKNQTYLLDIVAAASKLGCRLTLTLVGDGPDRSALEDKAESLGISEQVRFEGYKEKASLLISAHKAYIHAALVENMPFALIEAMSRGTPLFAPAVGGVPEMFSDGVEGRIIPLDSSHAAAKIIVEMFGNPDALKRMADLSRKRFLEEYEAAKSVNKLINFFSEIQTP